MCIRDRHYHYKITTPHGSELVTQCYFEGDPQITEQWEESHPGLVIPLEETENGLVGVFDIIMDEEATEVGIDNKPAPVPRKFILHPAYPNPFNNSTRIEFRIPSPGYVSIGIYDSAGKWVTSIIEKQMQSGTHNLHWKGLDMNGNPVSSGFYLIVMKYSGAIESRKIAFIK